MRFENEQAYADWLADRLREAGHRVAREVWCTVPGHGSKIREHLRCDIFARVFGLESRGIRLVAIECKMARGTGDVQLGQKQAIDYMHAFDWRMAKGRDARRLERPDVALLAIGP